MAALTLNQEAERILRVIHKGDIPRDSPYDIREIKAHLKDAGHFLVKGEWFDIRNDNGKVLQGQYVGTFPDQTILVDPNTFENYIAIPSVFVSLPGDEGVRSVTPVSSDLRFNHAMIPIPSDALDLFGSLPSGLLEGQFAFFVRGENIVFTKRFGKTLIQSEISKVIAKIITLDLYNATDDTPWTLPGNLRFAAMAKVLELLGFEQKQIKDTINDNNPEIKTA